ncbi:MAG: endonuclease/exonuclease/phosphatase family protein, partial [Caldilineaceae bacterium]|nr:endonuclease/exonuclease/phosphatase family protein [Caldilineaceae bacterium]
MSHTFSLLTINCFGGPHWSVRRRLPTLLREFERLAPDVVCLQEVQTPFALRTFTAENDTFTDHVFLPGLRYPFGALCTLSQLPIGEHHFIRYATEGRWLGPTFMDRLTRKGVLVSRLQRAALPIIVLNTHLLANYGANWGEQSRAAQDQQRQLHQLADLVHKQPDDALVLLAGDFNIPRGSWLYEEFVERSGLVDALAGDDRPTYRPFPGVPARYALPIDFV